MRVEISCSSVFGLADSEVDSAYRKIALVALFYFDVHDGWSDADDIGTELPDVIAARSEGMALAGQIIRDAARDGAIYEAWHLNVRDDTGRTLFRMDFNIQ